MQNVFEKNYVTVILRREKPEANTVRAKADTVRRARLGGKIPASEYWYASARQNVSAGPTIIHRGPVQIGCCRVDTLAPL